MKPKGKGGTCPNLHNNKPHKRKTWKHT